MRAECVNAVSRALGRPITQAEAQNIKNRITQAMRRIAAEDRAGCVRLTGAGRLVSRTV